MTLPASYEPVGIRCVLPLCNETGKMGISFNRDNGEPLRFALSATDARKLGEWITAYLVGTSSHSDKSGEIPSSEVSIPDECVKQCPPATSSAANSGVA